MSGEVLNFKEVAAQLKLAEKTVYVMANAGELAAFKMRGQWRIKRAEQDRWLDEQARGAVLRTAGLKHPPPDIRAGVLLQWFIENEPGTSKQGRRKRVKKGSKEAQA